MICVYPADCTDFSSNGNCILAPLSAEVTDIKERNHEFKQISIGIYLIDF